MPSKDQKPKLMLFGGDGTYRFVRKTSLDYEIDKPSPFSKTYLDQLQSNTTEREQKKQNIFGLWQNRVESQLVDPKSLKFISIFILRTFSL